MGTRDRRTTGLRAALSCVLGVSGLLCQGLPSRAEERVSLELVLALDASSSVSTEEFDLQMRGYATAFRDEAVLRAIELNGLAGGIAVAMVQWADARHQELAIEWRRLETEADALALSEEIDATPRFLIGGGTGIAGAIDFSLLQLDRNGFEGLRQTIDVSGDGRANQGLEPTVARDRAAALGVTINGLAILNEDPRLDAYYRLVLVTGPGAFVTTAENYHRFGEAIVEKLVREIGEPVVSQRTPPAAGLVARAQGHDLGSSGARPAQPVAPNR